MEITELPVVGPMREKSENLIDAVSSKDKQTMVFPTGHIGIFVGSKSQNEVCPKIADWLKPRSCLDEIGDETCDVLSAPFGLASGAELPASTNTYWILRQA